MVIIISVFSPKWNQVISYYHYHFSPEFALAQMDQRLTWLILPVTMVQLTSHPALVLQDFLFKVENSLKNCVQLLWSSSIGSFHSDHSNQLKCCQAKESPKPKKSLNLKIWNLVDNKIQGLLQIDLPSGSPRNGKGLSRMKCHNINQNSTDSNVVTFSPTCLCQDGTTANMNK